MKNRYPENIISFIIQHKGLQFSTKPKCASKRCPAYLRLLWIGNASIQRLKQIKKSINCRLKSMKLQVILKSDMLFPLNLKDNVTAFQKSSLIYKFSCKCNVCYIGHMTQRVQI